MQYFKNLNNTEKGDTPLHRIWLCSTPDKICTLSTFSTLLLTQTEYILATLLSQNIIHRIFFWQQQFTFKTLNKQLEKIPSNSPGEGFKNALNIKIICFDLALSHDTILIFTRKQEHLSVIQAPKLLRNADLLKMLPLSPPYCIVCNIKGPI